MNIPVYKLNHRRVTRNTAIIAAILVAFVGLVSLLAAQRSALAVELSPDDFVTTWKTDNSGISNSTSITMPFYNFGGGGGIDVDWNNDGVFDEFGVNGPTHDFGSPGTYTVRVRGLTTVNFTPYSDAKKLLDVDQWGTTQWTILRAAFSDASNMNVSATDKPDLSHITDIAYMFANATSFNADISGWDVSGITDLQGVFAGATSFNQPLSNWDVSSAKNISYLFDNATAFNQPLNNWDVSSATNIAGIFRDAASFNQPVDNWDLSSVTSAAALFHGATSFNQPLSSWQLPGVTDMTSMFSRASSFNQPLNNWDVSSVTNMTNMFNGATIFNQSLNGWDVSSVTDMTAMFAGATSFNQPINSWDVSSVSIMDSMFYGATAFDQPIQSWDTSSVIRMGTMFAGATSFNQPIDSWDVSSVATLGGLFSGATSFNQPLNSWDVSAVTNVSAMFYGASSFNQPLDNWNTSDITAMDYMFTLASSFNRSLGGFDMTNVASASYMLDGAGIDTEQYDATLRGWSTQQLTPNIFIGTSGLGYCTANVERQKIIDTFTWTFYGDTRSCQILFNGGQGAELNTPIAAGTLVGELTVSNATLRVSNPYTLTCDSPSGDEAQFVIDGSTVRTKNILNYDTPADQNGDNNYSICVRAVTESGHFIDQTFTVKVLPLKNITSVSFGVGSGGKKQLVVGGTALMEESGYAEALDHSLVTLNGIDLRFCSDGFGLTAEQIAQAYSGTYPNVAQNVTDAQPCYFIIDTQAGLVLGPTQAIIWLPDNFDTAARGTVSINGSSPFIFNNSNNGDTDLTATVDGSRPLDQHPVIKSLPTFSGVAEPGAVVKVTVHSDPVICITTADSNGNWSCTLTSALPAGEHTVYVQVTNPDNSIENLGPYAVTVGGTVTNETPTVPNTGVQEFAYIGILAGILLLTSVMVLGITVKSSR